MGILLAVCGGWAVAQASGSDAPDGALARVEPDPDGLRDVGRHQDGSLEEEPTRELSDLLDGLAQALASADDDAVEELLHDPESVVGERWRTRAANLADVPFDDLGLRLDPRSGTMTTDRARARFPDVDEVVVVGVLEEHVLAGHDLDGPARHRHTLTFVRMDGDWRLADDRDGRILGRPEPGFLWDLAPVTTTAQGPVLALHPEDAAAVDRLVAETAAAMEILPQRWPADWSQRTVLSIPSDREQLAHVVGGSLDLDDFLAFTSATTYSAPGVHEITGTRLVVNPDRFPASSDARERVLLHELVHVATRPVASHRIPLWLEEGVAQALGEQGPSTGHTRQLEALGAQGRRLPTDVEFAALGRQATLLAYQRSYSFVDHLVEVRGRDAVVDFYLEVGQSVHEPGTVGHRLDRAAERALGADLDALVADWRATG